MLKLALYSVLIIAICVLLLCVRIIFLKNGTFVKTHVSSSKAMRDRGVTCVQSQDRAARRKVKKIKEY